ncbi:MAG: hypothetical protein EOP61_19030 [Sphingomonadales bacterium]|nr:MAG: hypothetical protein EOP61_19030 [Sphingomonadales bacterium]
MSKHFVAHVSTGKMILLLLLATAFAAGGIWAIVDAEGIAAANAISRGRGSEDPGVIAAIGWILTLFAGYASIITARQMCQSGPVMEIDARGILWRRWSDQILPWHAIIRTEERSVRNQKFLCLWLDAPSRYPSRSTLGLLAGLNKGIGFGDIALTTQGTDQHFQQLVEAVNAHRDHAAQRVGTGSAPE